MRTLWLPKSFVGSLLALIAILVVFSAAAQAQSGRSTVRGTVKDQQGNVVAGASVTLANTERNFSRTQTTSQDGTYVFTAVPPDTYTLQVEATNFKKTSVSEVKALVDSSVDADVSLEVGAVSETVNVTAGGEAPLNTTDASLGVAFENRRIEQLPLNARNVVGLLSLQPGVTRDGYVNGGRADQSNITLDGVDVNEQQSGLDINTGEAFASVLRSTPDSLQEFRVTTTNANADQGRSSGAQVSLITKSGSNDWHGSLYHFHRNTVTTANDFFNNKDGVERPQLLRNIFGGAIGGPVKRDRAFFFFTYEGFREATAQTVLREVPLPSLGQGIVRYQTDSGASGTGCPVGTPAGVRCLTSTQIGAAFNAAYGVDPGRNPLALSVLADAARRYPANSSSVGDGLNTAGFRFNATTPSNLNVYHGRMDFNLTDRQTLFARGVYQDDRITRVRRFPDTTAPQLWNHPKGIAVGHTWTASNNIVNRFTYGLTRASFTDGGDSTQNSVSFRFIYAPLNFTRTISRTTPVHNFVDDVSWTKGAHSLQFGGNMRLIRNNRLTFGNAFDTAITNPSFYDFSGDVVLFDDNGDPIFPDVDPGSETDLRDALTAIIGRFSQYNVNLNYDKSGKLLPGGTGVKRTFATEEYELYGQDSWRIRPNLTLTYGVRWYTSTPVYETSGLQVKSVESLGEYFQRRVAGAEAGRPVNDLIKVDLAGKKNNREGYYKQDWNNFAPAVAIAWSPDFGDNWVGNLIGRNGKGVIRGGYRMTYDRIGSQLAVNFDLNSTLGFKSASGISANTFNVSDRLGPLFTGFGQNIRTLPGLTIPSTLTFPLTTAADEDQRIESSLDDTLTTPYNHSVNVSYGREIGKGLSFEASYVGRFARDLLATRDIMHLNNIKDPASGVDWYTAINQLIDFRNANRPITSIAPIPFFQNVLPGLAGTFNVLGTSTALTATQAAYRRITHRALGGRNTTDYTFVQLLWDDRKDCSSCPFPGFGGALVNNLFFHPQYAAFSTFSTIAQSNYNSAQFSLRQRFKNDLVFDLNYTLGHSLDNASGLQSSGAYGAAFIVNPLNPDGNYANSDFDVRHIVNANWLVGIPIGRNKKFFNGMNKIADGIFGGWSLTGIFRYNTGLPSGEPFDADRWATNWNVQSNAVRVRPLSSSPTVSGEPNMFSDPTAAFQSYRSARPGEAGDRNILRYPGYIALDSGLYKTFNLPWEGQTVQFRWEVFNVTNTQRLTDAIGFGLSQDPYLGGTPSSDFGKLTATQTPLNETKSGRVMQFALRYQF
ncbi:MAG: carboxypeptidase regulatory-like domain-containing protein [Pyrinomonadaceae bacterium]